MLYKIFIFAPDNEEVIDRIIKAASQAGAGIIGNYSQCAFIQKGIGTWKSGPGSHPFIGEVGKVTHETEVKIEMECPREKANAVAAAIKAVHPYEQAVVEFLPIQESL